jgi:hypothetical protein
MFDCENCFLMAILLAIIVVCCFAPRTEAFTAPFIPGQPWIEYPENLGPNRGDRLYLGGSTKCFSCEKDMIKRGMPTYLAHPTKCFDCESQAVNSYGSKAGHFGQNNSCFDCESQYAQNPFKGPMKTKCQKALNGKQSRFGRADGQSFDEGLNNEGVGLVTGFGRVDGNDTNEGDTTNPTGYTLN